MHLRDFQGFEETSRKMLLLKPSTMQNWVTLAAACYLNRNYTGCLQAVDSMLRFQDEESSKSRMRPHEASEIVLLAVRAHIAQGKH